METSYAKLHVKKRDLEKRKDLHRSQVKNKEHHSTNSSKTKPRNSTCKMIEGDNKDSSLKDKYCPKPQTGAGRVKTEIGDEPMEVQRQKGGAKEDAKDCDATKTAPLLTTSDIQTSAFMAQLKTILSILPTRHPPNPTKFKGVPLSKVLRQFPRQFSRTKISAVDKGINEIDDLPEAYKAVEVLYLSQNRLTSLKGLEHFPKVITLSVSHNPLTRLDVLNCLKRTNGVLKHASFVGTPMTKLPNYKAHVIFRLPWLASLDGEVIDEEQRTSAALIIEKERSLMAILIHNDCLIHKLRRLLELLGLHKELRKVLFGGHPCFRINGVAKPLYQEIDVSLFVRLWEFESCLDMADVQQLYFLYQQKAYSAYCRLSCKKGDHDGKASCTWDAAFTEVLTQQQKALCELLSAITKTTKEASESARSLGLCPQSKTIEQLKQQEERSNSEQASSREKVIKDLSGNVHRLKKLFNKKSVLRQESLSEVKPKPEQNDKHKGGAKESVESATSKIAMDSSNRQVLETTNEVPSQHSDRMDAYLIPVAETHPSVSTVQGKLPVKPFGATESSGAVKGATSVECETSSSKYKSALKRHDPKPHDPTSVLRQNALESLKSQSRQVAGKKAPRSASGTRPNPHGEPVSSKEDAVLETKESSMETKSYQQALLNSNTRMLEAEKNVHLLQQQCDQLKNSLKELELENGRMKYALSAFNEKEGAYLQQEASLRQNLANCEQVARRYESQLREYLNDTQKKHQM